MTNPTDPQYSGPVLPLMWRCDVCGAERDEDSIFVWRYVDRWLEWELDRTVFLPEDLMRAQGIIQ